MIATFTLNTTRSFNTLRSLLKFFAFTYPSKMISSISYRFSPLTWGSRHSRVTFGANIVEISISIIEIQLKFFINLLPLTVRHCLGVHEIHENPDKKRFFTKNVDKNQHYSNFEYQLTLGPASPLSPA